MMPGAAIVTVTDLELHRDQRAPGTTLARDAAMVHENLAKIRMTVTPWRLDERGNRWREVHRAEDLE
jgi:hypothetical protein